MTTITTEVEIDVDLCEFDSSDLIEELSQRIDDKQLANYDMIALQRLGAYNGPEIKTLLDQMKLDLFLENFNKFTLEEMEQFF